MSNPVQVVFQVVGGANAATAIRNVAKEAKEAGGGLRSMIDGAFRLVGIQSPLQGTLGQSADALRTMSGGAEAAAGTLGVVATAAVGVAAAGAAAAAVITKIVFASAAFADQQGKEAEKVGLAVEKWSEYQHGAEMAGASAGELKMGLTHLSQEIASGGEVLARMGIQVRNADGTLISLGDAFEGAADKIAGYKDGAEKVALVQELFGRSGKELLPLLNEGKAGLAAYAEELARLGGTVTREAAQEGDRFGDAIDRISKLVHGLVRQFGDRLVPAFADLAERFLQLTPDVRAMGSAFDTLTAPVKGTVENFLLLVDVADSVTGALVGIHVAAGLAIGGNVTDAKKQLLGLKADFESIWSRRADRLQKNSEKGSTTGTPADKRETAPADDKKAKEQLDKEKKLQNEMYQIRQKGLLDLQALEARGGRSALDADFKAQEISISDYFAVRRALVEQDHAIALKNIDVQTSGETDLQKREAMRFAARQLADAERANALAALSREEDDVAEKAYDDALKEIDAADELNRKLDEKTAKEKEAADASSRRIEVLRAEEALRLAGIPGVKAESDATKTIAEKRAATRAALQAQIALYPPLIAALQAEWAAANPEEKVRLGIQLNKVLQDYQDKLDELKRLEPPTFFDRLRTQMGAMMDQWSQVGKNMADVLTNGVGAAVGAVSDEITNAIFRTGEWGDAFAGVARGIIRNIIEVMLQMAISQGVSWAIESAFGSKRRAAAKEELATNTANAAAASGSSWGISAIVGLVAFVALMGAVAHFAGAFADGGTIRGPGGPRGDKIMARVSDGEEVVSAPGANRFRPLLKAISAGASSYAELSPHLPVPDYGAVAQYQQASGRASAAAMPAPTVNVAAAPPTVIVANGHEQAMRAIQSFAGQKVIVQTVDGRRMDLGFEG